ncbi:hypothetical protein CYMTET_28944 [Cymbomonas tetramitiformis]|uniref:Nucleotide exchange factor Fes1 domain-containing protein n=1 Tax=Cymbomonas tetramitiformis TaxID=36881 RepID=A0AAE0C8D9_9CHLO|nr:hypothetical protein CYMTET_40308 [Cymbomonas tetramitiformis]KAK3262183.1 hypothetical protein CYMTET_28944 [Cymbomonas tetramitiformis]
MSSSGEPDWSGLLKWSLNYCDGTTKPQELPAEERAWLEAAMKDQVIDEVSVMKQINGFLSKEAEEGVSEAELVETKEELLEELQDIVDSIDRARDLTSIGGFPVLMELLSSRHEGLRWRSAEVIATSVQNNPPVQQWALDQAALPALICLCSDPVETCKVKALLALSCLIRGHEPAQNAFRESEGLQLLCKLVTSEDTKVGRKAVQLLRHLLRDNVSEYQAAVDLNLLDSLRNLVASSDMMVREQALQLLLECCSQDNIVSKVQALPGLQSTLQARLKEISSMDKEDQEASREEQSAITRLISSVFTS